ncbi:MAG TPA: glycosyltransferase family 4 protein [Clostridia bacterium]|nr:glycosyltransferase family 4 protein [Clostridia bacterium]
MKILFVLTYYRPHWTGLTQYAARLAEGLAKKGYLVEVLCSQHEKSLARQEKIKGVRVFRLPFLFRFLRSVVMPSFPLALWQRIRKNQAIVVYLPFQEVALVALVTRVLGKKLFLVHNGDLVLPQKGGWRNRLIEKIYCWLTAFSIALANAVIIQTKDYAQSSGLLSCFPQKWRIILPLYDLPAVSKAEVENFKKKNQLGGKVLIGFSGRLVEEKGVDYLLQAIPLVVEKIPEAHFVFAGECKVKYENFWQGIRPLIEKNRASLTLLGLLKSQKEVFSFYKAIDVLVQPSRTDCFPSSQIEALLSGIPSVCTDIPGASWAVSKTQMGVLVEPRNPSALAKGVLEVLKNKRKYQAQQGKVKKIFDNRKILAEYEELFKKG